MADSTNSVNLFSQTLSLAVTDQGRGRAYLLLHGGAGPASMQTLAAGLAKTSRAVAPTHPGFNGEDRPRWFGRVEDLVLAYFALIEKLDLTRVVVVGNSFGGWVAAEMALRHSPRIAGLVLLNPVGIDTGSPDKTIVDPLKVAPADRSALSFHNPGRFAVVPSGPQLEIMASNQRAMRLYAGEGLIDPALRPRLKDIEVPVQVVWGASDRIADADYGRLWAASIPGATFDLVPEAGHFPQIEQTEAVLGVLARFP